MTAILGALHDNTTKDHDASRFAEKVSSHTYREFLVTREELRDSGSLCGTCGCGQYALVTRGHRTIWLCDCVRVLDEPD